VLSEKMILFSLKNLGHIAFIYINKIFICYILAIIYKLFKGCMLKHFCYIINFVVKCTEINLEYLYGVPNGKNVLIISSHMFTISF